MFKKINKKIINKTLVVVGLLEATLPQVTALAVGTDGAGRNPAFGYRLLAVILLVFAASIWNYNRKER